LQELLGQIDISMRSTGNTGQRKKRFVGLLAKKGISMGVKFAFKRLTPGRFKFSSGTKLAWSLFGLAQNSYTGYTAHKAKAASDRNAKKIAEVSEHVAKNSAEIQAMSKLLEDHSFAISQLTIATEELSTQLKLLEERVILIESIVGHIESRLHFDETMQLLESLIDRITDALHTGLERMKDIVHSALLGQTSPLLLPPDQIDLVQGEVLKASSADLDTDFSRMQSVIVSDPDDPKLLMILISATALARRNQDLVQMYPIPSYGKKGAYEPKMSYTTVVLDQLENSYTMLEEGEISGCMEGRCYLSNQARPNTDSTCGIPQYYGKQLEACEFAEVSSNGMYVQPLLPDGVVFSFKETVTSQLFCNNDVAIGESRKLEGAGILIIPPGCQIAITGPHGRSMKVRGLPVPHLISADDLKLISEEQAKLFQFSTDTALKGLDEKRRQEAMLYDSVAVMKTQVADVDEKVNKQTTHAWALTGMIAVIILAILLVSYCVHRNFATFQRKWRNLLSHMGNVAHVINEMRKRLLSDQDIASVDWPALKSPASVLRRVRAHFSRAAEPEYLDVEIGKEEEPLTRPENAYVRSKGAYPCEQLDKMRAYEQLGGLASAPPMVPPRPSLLQKLQPNADDYDNIGAASTRSQRSTSSTRDQQNF
jgi:hypothetical protein